MRRSSFRLSIATLLVVGGCAAALAIVSGSKAGAVTGAQFDMFAQPQALTVTGTGFVKAVFKAPSGSGTGSATHVKITIDLPPALAFNQSSSSSGCSVPTGSASVICTVGTVNAGATITRFVTFTAPNDVPTPPEQPINGTVSWDNGTGGKGGGGGSVNSMSDAAQTTIFASTDSSHRGNCLFQPDDVGTPTPSNSDNQSTNAHVETADPSLGIPCAYADVGEDGEGVSVGHGFSTAISHDNIAKLTAPAKITITLYSLPKPFSQMIWHYLADYSSLSTLQNISTYPTIDSCTDGTLPAGATVPCLLSSSNKGHGSTWTFLQNTTGSDPGFGS
jgi:hypothetical protein